MGYARLQLLLGYVVPEFVEEEWLSEEEANKMTDGETLQGPPLHVPYRPYGEFLLDPLVHSHGYVYIYIYILVNGPNGRIS